MKKRLIALCFFIDFVTRNDIEELRGSHWEVLYESVVLKIQERSMQFNWKWTSSRVFFKDFNQKFISLTLWNSHFHNTKCRRTPLSGWFWHFGTCPFEIIFVKQQQSVLHFLLQKSCNVTQGLFKYVFCYWNELLWRFIICEFCVTFYRG